jgi:hypothetical protein
VEVADLTPAMPPPIAIVTAAISSSDWTTVIEPFSPIAAASAIWGFSWAGEPSSSMTPCASRYSLSSLAGVIG